MSIGRFRHGQTTVGAVLLLLGAAAGLVGAPVAHELRRARDGLDGLAVNDAGRMSYQGKQSAHPAKYARTPAAGRTGMPG